MLTTAAVPQVPNWIWTHDKDICNDVIKDDNYLDEIKHEEEILQEDIGSIEQPPKTSHFQWPTCQDATILDAL